MEARIESLRKQYESKIKMANKLFHQSIDNLS